MVLGDVEYTAAQFGADYSDSISCNWPVSKSLLVRNSVGSIILNPEFELHISNLSNWSLDLVFASKYPKMAPLVNIRN